VNYYLLFFNEEMVIHQSLNVEEGQPSSLEVCLRVVDQTKNYTRLRYDEVPEPEYLTYWKGLLGTKITS
jgi:hypothetical protein